MTLYYSTFYYSISSRFRWKFDVPWRFFALLFDFWWVKRPLGRYSKLRFTISKLNFSKFMRIGINYHKFSAIQLSNLKFSARQSIFVPIRVQTNPVALIFFVPSSLIRYFPSVYRIRETSHYSMRSHIRWKSNPPLKWSLLNFISINWQSAHFGWLPLEKKRYD